MPADPSLFQPTLFAHGRLLWRFEGSDAARLSPRIAWRMVARAATVAADHPGAVLWDPFCGTGLLPAIALLFQPDAFAAVHATDAEARAVATTRRNLALVTDPTVAAQRKEQALGLSRQNPKSARRWTGIADYLDVLAPAIQHAAARATTVLIQHGRLDALPPPDAPTLILGDAPYGHASPLLGPPLPDVLAALAAAPQVVWIDLIVTPDQAQAVCDAVPEVGWHRAPGGRARVRYPSK